MSHRPDGTAHAPLFLSVSGARTGELSPKTSRAQRRHGEESIPPTLPPPHCAPPSPAPLSAGAFTGASEERRANELRRAKTEATMRAAGSDNDEAARLSMAAGLRR